MKTCSDCGRSVSYNSTKRCRPCENVARSAALPSVKERLLARISIVDGCWEWTAELPPEPGYPRISINGKVTGAHRAAYKEWVGPIASGFEVCHHCDNRKCINPEHLFVGPHSANAADAVAKGRMLRGEQHPSAKLTEADVWEIRRAHGLGTGNQEIANRFGVSDSAVYMIVRNKTWRHLTEVAA